MYKARYPTQNIHSRTAGIPITNPNPPRILQPPPPQIPPRSTPSFFLIWSKWVRVNFFQQSQEISSGCFAWVCKIPWLPMSHPVICQPHWRTCEIRTTVHLDAILFSILLVPGTYGGRTLRVALTLLPPTWYVQVLPLVGAA